MVEAARARIMDGLGEQLKDPWRFVAGALRWPTGEYSGRSDGAVE
jgi:hypothetical protein